MNFIALVLAAGPAAAQAVPQAATPADPLGPLYYLLGSQLVLMVIGMAAGIVRWLGSRTVQREDEDKKALKASIEALQKKYDERFEEQDDQLNDLDKSLSTLQSEVKSMRETLENIRGGVAELKPALDARLEKQAQHYREATKEYTEQVEKKLTELEYKLRQDMTRAVADHMRARGKK